MKTTLSVVLFAVMSVLSARAETIPASKHYENIYNILVHHVQFPTDCGMGECHIDIADLYCFQTNDGRSTDCQVLNPEMQPYNFRDEVARYFYFSLVSLGVKPIPVEKGVQKMIKLNGLSCVRRGTGQEIPFTVSCVLKH